MLPLQVVDYRVAVYVILDSFKAVHKSYDEKTQESWLKAVWAIMLNRGFTGLPYIPHTCVVVDDSSPYWKAEYVYKFWSTLGTPEEKIPLYKAGRPSKDQVWYMVNEVGKRYVCAKNSPIFYLSFDSYEADDIAATLVRMNQALNRRIYLHTIDSDWLGLVNEEVHWCGMTHYTPRYRRTPEALAWAKKRLNSVIDTPRQIWDVKQLKGDKSDNLPGGSPLEVIDLLAPPSAFDLTKHLGSSSIKEALHCPAQSTRLDHLHAALGWMKRQGFQVPLLGINTYPLPAKETTLTL